MSTLPPLQLHLPSRALHCAPLRPAAALTATRHSSAPTVAPIAQSHLYRVQNNAARDVLSAFLLASAERMARVKALSPAHLAPLTATSDVALSKQPARSHSPIQDSMDVLMSLSETSEHDSVDGTLRDSLTRKRPLSDSCERPVHAVKKRRCTAPVEKSTDETILLAMFPNETELFIYDSIVNPSTVVGEVIVSSFLTIADIRTIVQKQLAAADKRIADGAFELSVKGQHAILLWHHEL